MIKDWLKKLRPAEPPPLTPAIAAQAGAQIVSCAPNPMDLQPALTAIMQRIKDVSASLNGRPLVVLVGENHEMPSHKILQTLLLKKLRESHPDNMACGVEVPGNKLGEIVSSVGGDNLTAAEKRQLNTEDPSGQKAIGAYLAYINPLSAPVARHTQLDFCRSAHIPTRFTDAAETAAQDLDASDPLTGKIMKAHPPGWRDNATGSEGTGAYDLKIRNLVMTAEAQEHLKQVGAGLYVQQAGVAHILGSKIHKSGYSDSLQARFRQAGFDTLSILITSKEFDLKDIPVLDLPADLSRCLIIKDTDGKTVKGYHGDESEYIKALLKKSQADLKIFDYRSQPEAREELQDHVDSHAGRWIKSLRAP